MGHIKGKLRADIDLNKGRSSGNSERVRSNIERYTSQMESERIDNEMKKINAKIEGGDVSKEVGGWLKKNIS
jgi:hypothetical protein